jgi:hypothetical protein
VKDPRAGVLARSLRGLASMTRIRGGWLLAIFFSFGCEEVVAGDEQLECASSDGADATLCDDFNGGDDSGWSPEGGSWEIVDGRYVGHGPSEPDGAACASLMTASLREGSEATDLTMHAELGSDERLDKTIVLRATDGANRIELNFRGAPINDVIVQELVDCEVVYLTEEGQVHVEQPEGERIGVDVMLRGERLEVTVDGQQVIGTNFPFANTGEGRAGVAVIDGATTTFDDVWMTRL